MAKIFKKLFVSDTVATSGNKCFKKLTTEESIVGTWILNPTVSKYEGEPINNITNATFSTTDENKSYIEAPLCSITQGTSSWFIKFQSFNIDNTIYPYNMVGFYGAEGYQNVWYSYYYKEKGSNVSSSLPHVVVTFGKDINNNEFKEWLNANGKRLNKDGIIGTWVFNSTISVDITKGYNIEFTSNGSSYNSMSVGGYQGKVLYYGGTPVYDTDGYGFGYKGWLSNSSCHTITITGGNDIENETFVNWLNANALQQS